jgi:hypothetical protein
MNSAFRTDLSANTADLSQNKRAIVLKAAAWFHPAIRAHDDLRLPDLGMFSRPVFFPKSIQQGRLGSIANGKRASMTRRLQWDRLRHMGKIKLAISDENNRLANDRASRWLQRAAKATAELKHQKRRNGSIRRRKRRPTRSANLHPTGPHSSL